LCASDAKDIFSLIFGTSAEFWLNLQKLYELRIAERKAGKAVKALPTLADHRNRSRAA